MNSKVKWLFNIVLIYLSVTSCVSPSVLTTNELNTGNTYSNENDFKNAIASYQKYLDKSKTLGKYRNLETEADVNRKIAFAYSTNGKFKARMTPCA